MSEILPEKTKAQIWQERIETQVKSGQPIRVFCEEQHINCNTFNYWKLKFQNRKSRNLKNRFVSIPKKASFEQGLPRIHLPNGVKIELGEGLESGSVSQFLRDLCGVGNARS